MTREEQFVEKIIDMTTKKELVWSHRHATWYTTHLETTLKKALLHVSPSELKIEIFGEGSPIKIPMDRCFPEKLYLIIQESKRMTPEVEAIIDNFLKDKDEKTSLRQSYKI